MGVCMCVFCNVWVFWLMCTIGVLVLICVLLFSIMCTCVYTCSVLLVLEFWYFFVYMYVIFYLACLPPCENSIAISNNNNNNLVRKVGLNNCGNRQISWHLPEIRQQFLRCSRYVVVAVVITLSQLRPLYIVLQAWKH